MFTCSIAPGNVQRVDVQQANPTFIKLRCTTGNLQSCASSKSAAFIPVLKSYRAAAAKTGTQTVHNCCSKTTPCTNDLVLFSNSQPAEPTIMQQ
jgi:hypothetical protein